MKVLKYVYVLVFLIAITSCANDNNIPLNQVSEVGETNPFLENFGNATQSRFTGTVVNEQNNPIAGVTVAIGSKFTTTDSNGVFSVLSATVFQKFAHIKATKVGFIDGSRSLVPTEGVNRVKIMLLDIEPLTTITSGQELTLDLPDGTEVVLSGDFVNQFGGPYQGQVAVTIKHLNVDNEAIKWQMPGALIAENSDGDLRILETVGMISVELRGQSGEKLNIDPETPATIRIPVAASITNPPATLPLWSYDEENGYWIEEGIGILAGNKFEAQVTHFSFWNWDFPYPPVTVCITLQDANGNVLPGQALNLYSPALNRTGTYGFTNNQGIECGLVPKDDVLTLEVPNFGCLFDNFTTTIGPFSADDSVTITVSTNSALTTNFTAIFNDCNGSPITNGYLKIFYNNESQIIPITDGTISQIIDYCSSNTTFSAQAIDITNSQSTVVFNGNFTSPNTNLGTEISCTDLTDSDSDGVIDLNEDLNGNTNLEDDDTDDDGTPNYLDEDDDGDGFNTADEDYDNDGNPMNEDSDGDGIPDYLDAQDVIDFFSEIYASNCDTSALNYDLTETYGQTYTNTTFLYFETQIEADTNINPIANPSNYTDTSMLFKVYVRATNTISNQFSVGEIFLLGLNITDSDGDGLTDCEETTGIDDPNTQCIPNGVTNPNNVDTNGDGINDCI